MGFSVFVWKSSNWSRPGVEGGLSMSHNNQGVSYNLTEAHSMSRYVLRPPLIQSSSRIIIIILMEWLVRPPPLFAASSWLSHSRQPSVRGWWWLTCEFRQNVAPGLRQSGIVRQTGRGGRASKTVASWWTRTEFNFCWRHPKGVNPGWSWQWQIPPITLSDYGSVVMPEFMHRLDGCW